MLTIIVLLLAIIITRTEVEAAASEMRYGKATFSVYPGTNQMLCRSLAFYPHFKTGSVNVQLSPARSQTMVGPMMEASSVWVEETAKSGFTACVQTSGTIKISREVSVQWMAFSGRPSTGLSGKVTIPMFTTGSMCKAVYFAGRQAKVPNVLVTPFHQKRRRKYDASLLWTEDVNRDGFHLCMRELKNYDGKHDLLKVEWLALFDLPSEWKLRTKNSVMFENTSPPLAENHYSYCQDVFFLKPFYSAPVLIVTPSHNYTSGTMIKKKGGGKIATSVDPKNNALTTWVENVGISNFKLCVKDLQPRLGHHDPASVDYVAVGDLHPCNEITCKFFAVCKAFGPTEAKCVCINTCPTYETQVCSSDGITFPNPCEYQKLVCLGQSFIPVAHEGSCIGFIFYKGRVSLRLSTTVVQCKEVVILPNKFNSNLAVAGKMYVVTTINYFNSSTGFVHDAAVSWTESISTSGFTVCALKAGRNDRTTPDSGLTFIDYFIFQGAPTGTVTGRKKISDWWEGTTCKTVDLPLSKFDGPPYVIVTAEHASLNQTHDATTVWIEELGATSFKICLRELQSFDGHHKDIHVNWMAYQSLPAYLTASKMEISFSAYSSAPAEHNNANCKDVPLPRTFLAVPTILISASHPSTGLMHPAYNSISTWIEQITVDKFRVCFKELHAPHGYDPVKISALIMGH